MDRERLFAIVTGLVQGVNFRAFIRRRALELELSGYVRNRADGAVEIISEGSRGQLDRLADAARRGSPAARVENVETDWSAATGEFTRFEIRF